MKIDSRRLALFGLSSLMVAGCETGEAAPGTPTILTVWPPRPRIDANSRDTGSRFRTAPGVGGVSWGGCGQQRNLADPATRNRFSRILAVQPIPWSRPMLLPIPLPRWRLRPDFGDSPGAARFVFYGRYRRRFRK